ncbi:MAG: hypothetical protein NE328_15270 [Lentisphaeraceae bacterium]|nr:hypothetical protein [Lentisphaeraceae bacterium]
MGLFEFFFPQEAQAIQTRKIAENQSKIIKRQRLRTRIRSNESTKNNKDISKLSHRVKELENDLGFISLLLSGVITKLDQNGVVQKEELKEILQELDGFDGVIDGKLDINVLRGQTHN